MTCRCCRCSSAPCERRVEQAGQLEARVLVQWLYLERVGVGPQVKPAGVCAALTARVLAVPQGYLDTPVGSSRRQECTPSGVWALGHRSAGYADATRAGGCRAGRAPPDHRHVADALAIADGRPALMSTHSQHTPSAGAANQNHAPSVWNQSSRRMG